MQIHRNRGAERQFGLLPSKYMIRQWRKQEEQLLKMPKRKKALRGKPEKCLKYWFLNLGLEKWGVSYTWGHLIHGKIRY